MKLRGLELEQFRKFDHAVRLSGFGDRMNVLSGPNEFGKSTILAGIRGLLFERHNSKADPIKKMQNRGGNAAPHLAMDFETGGGLWRIEKRFLSQPMARLTGPDGRRFDNDAAEEELQRLLGFGASGKQGAKPENMGVWGALWVTQRDSVLQADLSSDMAIARSTITSCLDAEVGVLTGTESGQALIRAVREQRGALLDGFGKPKGRYKDVSASLEAVGALLADLEARSQRLSEDAAELRRATEKLDRENDPGTEKRDRDALAEARRLREAAMVYAEQFKHAELALGLSRRDFDDARGETRLRDERAALVTDMAKQLGAEQLRLAAARRAEADADAVYADCRREADAALSRHTEAAIASRTWRGIADMVRRAGRLAGQQDVLAKAELEQGKISDLAARLETMKVSTERLDAVRQAQRELDNAVSLLEAQATQIVVALEAAGAGKVSVNGQAVGGIGVALAAVDNTDIVIAGIGAIRISPAVRDREKLDRRLDTAKDALAAALAAAACGTATEAEARFAEREMLQRDLADSRAALHRLVPGDAAVGMAPGIAALREHVAVLAKRIAEERATAALAELPTQVEALAKSHAADADELDAGEALRQLRAESDIAGDRRSEAREVAAGMDADTKSARAEHARLEGETAAAAARETAAALAERLEKASADQARCAADLAALKRGEPPETEHSMAARIERYEQALAMRQHSIRGLREKIAELRARIAQEGGHGLDEQIEAARRQRDALKLEQEGCLRDTKILNLLLETLTQAERDTKERYLAPVVRRVTPYLRSLFPGADVACDEALRITGLTRDSLGTEDFERLSDGTQEQIAVLSRLAFAEMLIDQGKPAMVILDDALAYSDADRMERMFDILTQASAKTQILVLTCREDLFSRLGGNRIELARVETPATSAAPFLQGV